MNLEEILHRIPVMEIIGNKTVRFQTLFSTAARQLKIPRMLP